MGGFFYKNGGGTKKNIKVIIIYIGIKKKPP